ncbi:MULTISPECIES: preprotein translocase subunit YajC [Spiribacter]|jgi:preprotein translocase subunit YajC|uniref:Sec translocon accessory complex subunit YajC n=1 Tax=Spiribacter aquaticus TaxID=1935996 RepID=A0A557RJZ7_9GAMM|nr:MULTISPECIES: preprotein translocase subunit YajC [Spiribacter]PYZ99857.1 preprotein translocase subunit YajC [Gammaproteobacteria bacterium 2W06]AUB78027.1 preprotein translocase subunit YajC [Spiribacter roseus]KAF0279994.1 preprotein translocase subunit YajC [Spiribacter roseus]KAF0281352.1 preprotein translocase subunit YajC [Spiribacter roseus]KAF0283647.1 preprotein translocase subunit YajC [Spiribacter roseus]
MDFFINDALAQSGGQPGAGLTGLIFPIALIVIFYFLLIRPQQKRAKEHKKLVQNLSKGDEVLTNGGLVGRISDVGDTYANVSLAEGVEVRLQKSAVAQVLPKGAMKAGLDKADAGGKDDTGKGDASK